MSLIDHTTPSFIVPIVSCLLDGKAGLFGHSNVFSNVTRAVATLNGHLELSKEETFFVGVFRSLQL